MVWGTLRKEAHIPSILLGQNGQDKLQFPAPKHTQHRDRD